MPIIVPTPILDPRLDRRQEFDPASRRRLMLPVLEETGAILRGPRSKGWSPGPGLDQGAQGSCVGFGTTHRRQGLPVRETFHDGRAVARMVYDRAQELDQWSDTPPEEGTSVLAGMKAGKELGWWQEYRWIGAGSGRVIDDAVDTLSWIGGIVIGVVWTFSMMTPRPSGLLEVPEHFTDEDIVGGHCLYLCGIRLKARLKGETPKPMEVVVAQQSWGLDHGIAGYRQPGGFVLFRLGDLERLLEYGGEGAVPFETKPSG